MDFIPDKSPDEAREILLNASLSMAKRHRALFLLKSISGELAVNAMLDCLLQDQSDLLKHECAFCLGQMQNSLAVPKLLLVLQDENQQAIVRHEAGEALGAIGSLEALPVLEKYSECSCTEIAETCQLAVERIKWLNCKEDNLSVNPYLSIDPAPPTRESDINKLQEMLLDEKFSLFARYRAMFSLRNIGGPQAAQALVTGLKSGSALFRHEIAYVLGQMQEGVTVDSLKEQLEDVTENAMVRHECVEALGSIATPECMDILKRFLQDEELVVKQSCEVALDMCR